MAQKKVSYDQKSGVVSTGEYVKYHGGIPPEKDVKAIEKANTPKKAPGSVGN